METQVEMPKEAADAVKRGRLKQIHNTVTEGIGAIRKSSVDGHDIMAMAELMVFLKGFAADVKKELDTIPEPQPEFGRKEAK